MHKRQKQMLAGLLAAAGAVPAFFGARALVSWMRRRSAEKQYPYLVDETWTAADFAGATTPADESMFPDTTMPVDTTMPAKTSMSADESMSVGASRTGDTYMPARNDYPGGMPPDVEGPGMPEAGVIATGSTEAGENYEPALQGEDERANIPTTGLPNAEVADMPREREAGQENAAGFDQPVETSRRAETYQPVETNQPLETGQPVETDQPVPVGSLVGPLVVHLISFHNMMEMLRRRRETASAAGANTPDVRAGGADAVGSLEGQVPSFDRSALVRGSLQESIIQMMDRIRDTLQNMDYSEDQLFHLRDEMRPAVCKILEQIHKVEEDNVTGFEDVRKDYGCSKS